MGSKQKEVTTGDKEGQWLSKKARRKYCGDGTVKMWSSNSCKRCVCVRQDCLVHPSRWVVNNYTYYYFLIIFFFIATLLPVLGALHSSSSIYPTLIPTPRPWSPLIAGFQVPLKRHSGSLWRSTEELGSPSKTWWRARRGTRPNWRKLGLW